MRIFIKKIPLVFLAVSILTAISFSDSSQASFLDTIKAWITINPLDVDVSAPAEVEVGRVFKTEARVINKGEEKIEKAQGEIFLPEGLILLRKDSLREIGIIPGKKEKKIFWSVKGEKEGNYFITVLASGELRGELIKAEDSTMVKVKLSLARKNFWQRLRGSLRFLR